MWLTCIYLIFPTLFLQSISSAICHLIQEKLTFQSSSFKVTLSHLLNLKMDEFTRANQKCNVFWLWTQIEPLKVKFFKNIHLDVLDFHVNLCLHLTFPKQATYCPQRVSGCNHIFHTLMITKITEVIKSYRGPWSKNYFFNVIHHTHNKEAWLQPFNISPKEEIAQISLTNQNLMAQLLSEQSL